MTDHDDSFHQPDDDTPDADALDSDLTGMLDALRDGDKPAKDAPAEEPTDVVAPNAADSEEPIPAGGASSETVEMSASPAEPATGTFSGLFGEEPDTPDEVTSVFAPPADMGDQPSWWADESGDVVPVGPDVTAVLPPVVDEPRQMDMGPSKRGRWWVWALVAVAALAVAGAAGYGWWWTTSRPIVAPDVVGKKPADATQTLNDVGLRLGQVSEVPTDAAPAGTIITQKPEAGTRLRPDDALSFVVAAAPAQAKVPNVVGVSIEQASATLAEARLRPFEIASYNTSVAAGFTVAQLPPSGAELAPGTAVAVVVSKGPAPASVVVPKLNGMSEADAMTLLRALNLQPRVYRSPDASLAAGVVGTQTPTAGVATVPGSVVQVLVSQGAVSSPVTVPDVVGQSRKTALVHLKAKGLVAQVVVVANATVPRGNVISQMPQAGGRSAPNGTVGLLISRGNVNDGLVPSLIGTASAEATGAITAAGFRPVVLTIDIEGQKSGTVFAQYPAPGVRYGFRLPMVCLVAKASGE